MYRLGARTQTRRNFRVQDSGSLLGSGSRNRARRVCPASIFKSFH